MPKTSRTSKPKVDRPSRRDTWIRSLPVTRLFYASVILFVLAATLLVLALASEHHQAQVRSAAAQSGYPLGTTLSAGVVTVRPVSVTYDPGEGVFEAPTGKEYAIIDFSVMNRSAAPISVLPTADTYVKDAGGHVIYLTPDTLDAPFHAGELPPGETVRGQLSFLVPRSGPLKFYVDAIWSGGVLTYKLR
ncbi:MAG TPA: DUF4352 domain-containing protein [Candidatus Saccharimonadales bacterium]|nr:DUF4352 domain-containing protein [Candidatus Saccharimonadales bacterium]